MTDIAFLPLLQNAAFLLGMAVVYDVATTRWTIRQDRIGPLLVGFLLGTIGVVIMLTPWVLTPGIIFDTRSVLLAVTGLVFGPVPTLVAMAMTAALRLSQGGAAAWVGVAVIIASGLIGIGWRRLRQGRLETIPVQELYLLGLVVHLVMLALMLTLPWDIAMRVLAAIGLPVILIYPVATAALGVLMINRLRRARATRNLRVSEERLRLALAAADQGLYDIDLRTGGVTVNDEYALMLGYDPSDFTVTNALWAERLHPDDRGPAERAYLDYLAGRRPDYRVEFRHRTRTGGWKWVLSLGEVVERDSLGTPLRMLGTHTDITARREAEQQARDAVALTARLLEEASVSRRALLSMVEDLRASDAALRELADALEERVRERTADLEDANRELGAFAYSVSHDLRAPLRAISGFSEILLRRHADELDEQGRHYLANIVESSRHMDQLIEHLLAYSRLGRQATRQEPVPLEPIVERLRLTFGQRLAEPGVRLDVEEPLATPLGDPTLVEQVLSNFVANALTYCRDGVAPEVGIEARRIDGKVILGVTDNGIGIAADHQERIFDVFVRLHSDEVYAGTGIGLAITRKAARLMDGEITVKSTPGSGSTFSLCLPAAMPGGA
ncbi:MAG: LytS/YhcK type 5TM receptor domain-containing protein [Chloroflexota bacterium]|nr:LytS/YhcK type 5TM receptor domain-containing protein [Chloroflexota bacterium]